MQEENVKVEAASEGIEAKNSATDYAESPNATNQNGAILGEGAKQGLDEPISESGFKEKQASEGFQAEKKRTFDISLSDILSADDEARNYIATIASENSSLLSGRDDALREYYEYVRRKILQDIISSKNERSIEERLKERYREKFSEVENEARKSFEAMAFIDALKLLSARQSGDISSLEKFYDSVAEKLRLRASKAEASQRKITPPTSLEAGGLNEKANIRLENFI